MTSHFIFRSHFGKAVQNSERHQNCNMEENKPTPTEIMNSTFKTKAPKFPEHISKHSTNNILFYMTQRLPRKVCTEKHVATMFLFFSFDKKRRNFLNLQQSSVQLCHKYYAYRGCCRCRNILCMFACII